MVLCVHGKKVAWAVSPWEIHFVFLGLRQPHTNLKWANTGAKALAGRQQAEVR
jgi:hypothetical protein